MFYARSRKGRADFQGRSVLIGRVESPRSRRARWRLVQGLRNVQVVWHRQISNYISAGRTRRARQTVVTEPTPAARSPHSESPCNPHRQTDSAAASGDCKGTEGDFMPLTDHISGTGVSRQVDANISGRIVDSSPKKAGCGSIPSL